MPRLQRQIGFGQLDRSGAMLIERARHRRRKARGNVLHDQRGRAIRRKSAQQDLQRLYPAGRGADRDQPRLCAQRCAGLGGHALRGGRARTELHFGGFADQAGQDAGIIQRQSAAAFGLGVTGDRTQRERAGGGVGALLRRSRHHDHRGRAQRHDLFQEIEPVHPGHLDIERDHIGIKLADHGAALRGIGGGAHHHDIAIAFQPRFQDGAHRGGIFHHHHPDRCGVRHAAFLLQ